MNDDTARRLNAWLREHRKAFAGIGWPEDGQDRIGILPGLLKRLVKEGMTHDDILFEITRRMMDGERTFNLQDHIKQIFIVGHALYRELNRNEGELSALDTLDGARQASKNCPVCHGMGILIRYRQKSFDPARAENSINVYCKCPYGRKIRENHRAAAPDVYRRYHYLVENPWLEDPAYSVPPRRVGESNVEMLDRAGRIKIWFDGQSEEIKAKWRRMATNAMPSLRNHPGLDDFVAGMICSQHHEFDPVEPEPVAAGRDESPY